MKIYHKKLFASGVFVSVLAALNVIGCIITHEITLKRLVLISVLALFGIFEIRKSLSAKRSREEKLEERDERNQLIDLKSKSRTFQITQGMMFVIMFSAVLAGAWKQNDTILGIGFGLAVMFTLSMLVELITFIYYESKN